MEVPEKVRKKHLGIFGAIHRPHVERHFQKVSSEIKCATKARKHGRVEWIDMEDTSYSEMYIPVRIQILRFPLET